MAESSEHTTNGRQTILRHGFTPNRPLEQAVIDFTGSYVRPGFILQSLQYTSVDRFLHTKGSFYEADLHSREAVERVGPINIGHVAIQPFGHKDEKGEPLDITSYRLHFLPVGRWAIAAFARLTGTLDEYPTTLKIEPAPKKPTAFIDIDAPEFIDGVRSGLLSVAEFKESIRKQGTTKSLAITATGIRAVPSNAIGKPSRIPGKLAS